MNVFDTPLTVEEFNDLLRRYIEKNDKPCKKRTMNEEKNSRAFSNCVSFLDKIKDIYIHEPTLLALREYAAKEGYLEDFNILLKNANNPKTWGDLLVTITKQN